MTETPAQPACALAVLYRIVRIHAPYSAVTVFPITVLAVLTVFHLEVPEAALEWLPLLWLPASSGKGPRNHVFSASFYGRPCESTDTSRFVNTG